MSIRTSNAIKTSLRISRDAHETLEIWSQKNQTSLGAEVTRSIREREARERKEAREWQREVAAS